MSLLSDQPGGRAKSRAVAKANGLSVENGLLQEADLRDKRNCQGPSSCPMASVGAEELRCTHQGSRRIEGGNT